MSAEHPTSTTTAFGGTPVSIVLSYVIVDEGPDHLLKMGSQYPCCGGRAWFLFEDREIEQTFRRRCPRCRRPWRVEQRETKQEGVPSVQQDWDELPLGTR